MSEDVINSHEVVIRVFQSDDIVSLESPTTSKFAIIEAKLLAPEEETTADVHEGTHAVLGVDSVDGAQPRDVNVGRRSWEIKLRSAIGLLDAREDTDLLVVLSGGEDVLFILVRKCGQVGGDSLLEVNLLRARKDSLEDGRIRARCPESAA
jgi:hypothetical protein